MKEIVLICPVTAEVHQFVRALPKADEEIEFDHVITAPGGSGFETAVQLQKISFPFRLFSEAGTGSYGDLASEKLRENGIAVRRAAKENGCLYHMVDKEGREAVLCMPGAEYNLSQDTLEALRDAEIRTLVLSGDIWFGENGDDLAEVLMERDIPELFYIHGERSLLPDRLLEETLFDMRPVMILKESELAFFSQADELDEAMKDIASRTGNGVIAVLHDSVRMREKDNSLQIPLEGGFPFNDFVFAYTAAIHAGCPKRNSLAAACAYAADDSPVKAESYKERLKDILLHI